MRHNFLDKCPLPPSKLTSKLKEAREIFDQPIVVGFGAKHPSQFTEIKNLIDGIVFGSSLISHIRDGGSPIDFMKTWVGKI